MIHTHIWELTPRGGQGYQFSDGFICWGCLAQRPRRAEDSIPEGRDRPEGVDMNERSRIDRDKLLELGYEWLDPYGIDGQPTDWSRKIVNEFADAITALIQPDPRIARIEALVAEDTQAGPYVRRDAIRAILAGW